MNTRNIYEFTPVATPPIEKHVRCIVLDKYGYIHIHAHFDTLNNKW